MKRLMVWALSMVALCGFAARAQDVTGQWQGTLHAGKDLRIIVKIVKDDGRLAATMYSIDLGNYGLKASGVSLDGSMFRYRIETMSGSYEGKLGADGKTMAGTWTQGGSPLALVLVKTTAETAWEIPAPPAPPKLMDAGSDPAFDVATIKPNPSGATTIQQLTMNGRNFQIRNGSLGDLIAFAYNVQMKQIVNAPEWMDKDRYDIDGVPDKEGAPSPQQLQVMMQKLLAERFGLKYHKEKRDLPAYVLVVGKNGQKLTPTQMNGPLPGYGTTFGAGGITMNVVNSTMEDLTSFLRMVVLDKPVVDKTGLTGRFDFKFTFMPDDSQFNGHPPKLPVEAGTTDTAPNLFDALQQQLGMKLTAEKTAVDVIAIDHVQKPSAN